MDLRRSLTAAELVVGTFILTVGLSAAAISAYRESFPGVIVGFALFVAGYKFSQFAVREGRRTPLADIVDDILQIAELVDFLMAVIGIAAIAQGFTLLIQSTAQFDFRAAVLASLLLFVGYATAHYAVNRTLV